MIRSKTPLLALLPLLAACLRDVGPGPYLGECAEPPDGVYTYGEAGIGTCLSGPTDLHFFEQDGKTWLAVTNADPFRHFASGSLLLIDWDRVALDRTTNFVDEVGYAVATDPYVGGVGYVADADKRVLLVTGRLSEDSRTRSARDEMFVFDVRDPTNPVPWSLGDKLTLEDDPQPLAVHDGFGRAYVANITDHSISVLDTTGAPIVPIDVAPRVELGASVLDDADGSGTSATVSLDLIQSSQVPDDRWTLSFIDASFRLWLPDGSGLHRWSTGGLGYVDSLSVDEIDPDDSKGAITEVTDPFYTADFGYPQMVFAADGDLWWIVAQASGIWNWTSLGRAVEGDLSGQWNQVLGGPSIITSDETLLVYHDGRREVGGDASIGLAVFDATGLAGKLDDPVLAPSAPYTSFEDPWVRTDLLSRSQRMWLSMWDGAKWTIGHTESEDTLTWAPPVEVLADPTSDVAAPVVTYANGRYRLWFSRGDGTTWHLAEAWSWDGLTWYDAHDVLEFEGPYDPRNPPRAGLFADATGGWRVAAETLGERSGLAYASSPYNTGVGFTIRAATGHEVGPEAIDASLAGILPTSRVAFGDRDLVYVTTFDDRDRPAIGLIERAGDEWVGVAADLVPDGVGGNRAGAAGPVVVPDGAGLAMYYGAVDAAGVERLRKATSTDGVAWTPVDLDVPEPGGWEALGRRPHSLEALPSGGVRLWYTGTDGVVSRIGALVSTDGEAFDVDPGVNDPWQFGVGPVGTFDDSGVADPFVIHDGETEHLWYAAFDGTGWAVGHATRAAGQVAWTRDEDVATGLGVPSLFGVSRTFSAAGVRSVVPTVGESGVEALYAGSDGATWRLGRAIGDLDTLYPTQRVPTAGDAMTFDTRRGDPSGGVIELQQVFDGTQTSGLGVAAMRLDPERGYLYLAAKDTIRAAPYIYVIDVRDDTREGFADRNYLDIEAILQVGQSPYSSGFRDMVPVPGTDLLYASGHVPDSIVVFDLSLVPDDAEKDAVQDAALAAMPLRRIPSAMLGRPFQDEDAGGTSQQRISGAGLAVTPDGETLLVTHFRENSLLAYDLRLGSYGELVRRTLDLGENPHVVRVTPDGRYAVVANYLGDVDDDGVVHSTLAVVDIDPASPDFMQVLTWIRNL